MRVLFMSLMQIQNINDRNLYADLLREFKDNGHEVYIVSPVEKRFEGKQELIVHNNVNILKVKIGNITKVNLIEKGITTLTFEKNIIKALKEYWPNIKFDLILFPTPPITFSNVIKYVDSYCNPIKYLLLKDIFPQNAVDLKMFSEKSPIYWYFRKKEKELYKLSDIIGCMSEANLKYIEKHNSEILFRKIEICPNTITPISFENLYDNQNIKIKYGLPMNKKIFIYGGNLGKPQGIEFIKKCILANEKSINNYILIVGNGTEYNKLKLFFEKNNINNSKLIKNLPKNEYEKLASICDVGLIFLDSNFTIPNFPSRILSYMQHGQPILAATDINTDIKELLIENEIGFWCESVDENEFMSLMDKITEKEISQKFGENSRRYLMDNFTSKHAFEIIMKHFKEDY